MKAMNVYQSVMPGVTGQKLNFSLSGGKVKAADYA
jgi:hypothetical protein